MEAVVIITILVLIQYIVFGIQTGAARGRAGVKAPAQAGSDEFERMNRVHLNTAEQLIVFLPALWMFAYYVKPLWAVGFGIVFIVGRFIYRAAYLKDPATRTVGFTLSFLPSAIMLVWVLVRSILCYFY